MSLRVEELSKRFGRIQALNKLSFEAQEGRIFGLIGPNGSGKSTTFRIILDLLNADEGAVYWEGERIKQLNKEQIGFLPEERGLYPKLKVENQLMYFGRLKGRSKAWLKPEIDYWLEHFELEDRRKDKPDTLSKGNQQKVQLIMSFLHKPKLLIFDEPFSGLDPVNSDFLKRSIIKLKEEGATIIFSSHRMDHVEDLCDSLCLLDEGEPLFSGDILDLKQVEGRRKLRLSPHLSEAQINSFEGVLEHSYNREQWTLLLDEEERARKIFSSVTDPDGFTDKFSLDYLSLEEIFKKWVGGNDAEEPILAENDPSLNPAAGPSVDERTDR